MATTDKKSKSRAPEYLAAGAALELAKLDDAIASAEKRAAEKKADRETLLKNLSPEVKALVDRLRGVSK